MSLFGPFVRALGEDFLAGLRERQAALAVPSRAEVMSAIASAVEIHGVEGAVARAAVYNALPWSEEALLDSIEGRVAVFWDAMEHLGLAHSLPR